MMPLKAFEIPKYAQIVNGLQERISEGTYAQGALLPSEAQLMAQFKASRPVVVRALGIMQQDGWIDAEQGRGRFVRRTQPRHLTNTGAGVGLLRPERAPGVTLLEVGVVAAPTRAAYALRVEEASPVLARRRLVTAENGPIELSTLYLAVELAAGTDLAQTRPIPAGIIEHLAARRGIDFDHATDRIGARLATAEETRLLQIGRRDAVLTILVTAYDTTGTPRLASDAIIPAVRAELDDTFGLS